MGRNRRRKKKKHSIFSGDGKIATLIGQQALQKAQKYLEVAGDVADAVIKLRDKPGVTDYVAVGLKFVQSAADATSSNLFNYFNDGWSDLEDWGFSEDLIDICCDYDVEEIAGNDNYSLHQAQIPGVAQETEIVGWSQESEWKSGPYIRTDRYEEVMMALGRAVWESAEGNAIELTSGGYKGAAQESKASDCVLRADKSRKENVYESQLAIDILERIKLFDEKGFNRSIMLLGPPGTGKTSILRFVANKLDLMSLRVNVGELDNIYPRDIVRAVELLNPTLLMIDDFDRFEHAHSMLTELEQVNRSVKIFMVTANSTENLDDAVIRPGRFDEIIHVAEIDPNIVEKLLGDDVSDELKEILQSWPVAFIAEFHKRRQVLGDEGAIDELEEFQNRLADMFGEEQEKKEDDEEELSGIPTLKMRKDGKVILPPELKKRLTKEARRFKPK